MNIKLVADEDAVSSLSSPARDGVKEKEVCDDDSNDNVCDYRMSFYFISKCTCTLSY